MLTKTPHPGNRLYRGEVTDFIDAMETYRRQMEYEHSMTETSQSDDFPLTVDDRRFMQALSDCARKAIEAKAIYERHVAAVKTAVAAELRAKGDETFTSFADALESGDYSELAI
jgi:hypothetical protein